MECLRMAYVYRIPSQTVPRAVWRARCLVWFIKHFTWKGPSLKEFLGKMFLLLHLPMESIVTACVGVLRTNVLDARASTSSHSIICHENDCSKYSQASQWRRTPPKGMKIISYLLVDITHLITCEKVFYNWHISREKS